MGATGLAGGVLCVVCVGGRWGWGVGSPRWRLVARAVSSPPPATQLSPCSYRFRIRAYNTRKMSKMLKRAEGVEEIYTT